MVKNNTFNLFKNKKVLITGHTGFKGAWLTNILLNAHANISGISLEAESLSLYNMLSVDNKIDSFICDIRDKDKITKVINKINPEIVFHMAAQPLVLESYNNPSYTFDTNVMGTVNILEALRHLDNLDCAVMVTTDKVYENREWAWGYRENDRLGGHDPYSASKACSELVISSYRKSFFNDSLIVSVRAGNVIGGGDFAVNRIIPDIVRAFENNETVLLRNPNSVRPWQHVLDVLYGYMLVVKKTLDKNINQYAYNFAPFDNGRKYTVEYITKKFIEYMGHGKYKIKENKNNPKEMNMLCLDASLARNELNWNKTFSTDESIKHTALWYKSYLNDKNSVIKITDSQIKKYFI